MIHENRVAEVVYQVQLSDLAKSLSADPNDHFPEVLATSRMVALMELAAARVMKPELSEGELSVGVGVNITHLSATPDGDTVKARATFLGLEGKLYKFQVELYDSGGLAGKGEHTRAIVKTARLVAKARQKLRSNFS